MPKFRLQVVRNSVGDASNQSQETNAQVGRISSSFRTVLRQGFAILGLFLIGLSIPIGFLTPFLPIGLPIGIVGVVLLGRNSVWGKRWMEGLLVKHPRLERLAPNWLMKLVFGREKSNFRP